MSEAKSHLAVCHFKAALFPAVVCGEKNFSRKMQLEVRSYPRRGLFGVR